VAELSELAAAWNFADHETGSPPPSLSDAARFGLS
jgi:hypothetical protein